MNEKKKLSLEETLALADQHHKKNNLKIAQKLYDEILKINPNYAEAQNNLGILLYKLGEYQRSKNCYKKAIQIQPNNSAAHSNLGFVFKELGENQKAVKCYEKAIQIQYNNVDAYNNLGILRNQLGEYQSAMKCFEKAIELQPSFAAAYYNLANTFKDLEKYQKAISYYQKAVQIQPNYPEAYYNLGNILNRTREYQGAMKCYQKAIQMRPNFLGAHNNLGSLFEDLGEYDKAINCYEKVIQIQPDNADAYNNLGNILKFIGEHNKAISLYEQVIQLDPSNLTSHWLSMNIFPIGYKNSNEINYYRKRFEKNINRINQLLKSQSRYTKKQLINAINSSTNFFFHYQGTDVLQLQKRYANLVEQITHKVYKKFHKKKKKSIISKYIKIGFVSSYFKNHSVSKTHKNWIIKLDKEFFKSFVYYIDNKFDAVTSEIKENVDNFFCSTDVDHLINKISHDNLDVLIYLDIGMHPKIQTLCSLRLAPLQCNTFGHPVTSGFKSIDYYFSSETMEPQNSQKHYFEKLINLPNIGVNYDFPDLSNIKKPNVLNKSKATIFLNLQNLFKLLPQDDHVYLDIIKKYPNCRIWFLQGRGHSITNAFKERVSELFQKEGYDFKKYSYFHPRCSQEEFLGLITESDIILDSFSWSGFNTSLAALSLNKPIVTCPSSFMRGRHTYGILKTLGVNEIIATSKEQYVEIAIKLATNIIFRNSIIDKIKKNNKKLYNDDKPIRFIENVLRKNKLQSR